MAWYVGPHIFLFNHISNRAKGAKDVTEKYSTDLRKLLHLASPIYPALNDNVVEDNSELEILTQTHYNRILHIQCTSDADTISESVRNYLNERKHATEMLYYFRFKSQDARFNTIPAMLRTFFAHAAYNRSRNSYIEKYFIRICKEQPLEYQFLLDVWEFDELTHGMPISCTHYMLTLRSCTVS